MGVVVLHPYKGDIQPLGIGRGHIVRVHIAGRRLRHDIKKLFKVLCLLPVVFHGLQIFQISYVLALENIAPSRQAKAGLLLGSAGQYALQPPFHCQRVGHIAPGTAGKVFPSLKGPAE